MGLNYYCYSDFVHAKISVSFLLFSVNAMHYETARLFPQESCFMGGIIWNFIPYMYKFLNLRIQVFFFHDFVFTNVYYQELCTLGIINGNILISILP